MKPLALWLALGLAGPPPRAYDGARAVEASATAAPTTAAPSAADPSPPPPRPSPRRAAAAPAPVDEPRAGDPVQASGVALIAVGAAGYVAMIVGLGLGAAAKSDLAPLRGRDEIDRRRDLLARGRTANRLALGAGIAGGVVMAIGIALVAVARRRSGANLAARPRRGWAWR